MLQFGVLSWFGFAIPVEESCRLIKTAGFDGIMLFWSNDQVAADVESARRNGLMIENIHAPFEHINSLWEDTIAGDELEQNLEKCIDDSSQFAIPTVVFHVTQGETPPAWNRIGLERLKRLVEVAEKYRINIALENLRRPEYLDVIFAGIRSERLGFCYDAGHENCYTQGADLLSRYGSKLMAIHLHDNDGCGDQHRIPGDGTINWRALQEGLKRTGYPGAVALEVIHESDNPETAESFLKRALDSARQLFEKFDS